MQTQFETISVLVRFLRAQECRELCEHVGDGHGEFLPFLLLELEHALAQADHVHRKYIEKSYRSDTFLSLLSSLSATSDHVTDELVARGLATQLARVFRCDRLKLRHEIGFKQDVLHAARCLWSVLLVQNGKHAQTVLPFIASSFHALLS